MYVTVAVSILLRMTINVVVCMILSWETHWMKAVIVRTLFDVIHRYSTFVCLF